MKNNRTMLAHPAIQRKIKIAALKAWFAARGPKGNGTSKQHYVANRYGRLIMRIDYRESEGFTVWGDCSANITAMIMPIINRDFL